MQRSFLSGRRVPAIRSVACALALSASGFLFVSAPVRADQALADRANHSNSLSLPVSTANASDFQPVFSLDDGGVLYRGRDMADCQVPLPPVGAVSPFPLALRLGALVSPRLKFAGGIDATIPGLHLLPKASSRVDLDAIVSANFGGISTLAPLTFDQIFTLNLPVSSRIYVGGGIGPYFGDVTRFGGKLLVGAEFSRLGVEADVHFAGSGDALITVQARVGL